MLLSLRSVDPLTLSATIALAPRWIEARFVLFPVRLAFWTVHASYSILSPILGTLKKRLLRSITGQNLFDNAGGGQYLSVSVQNESVRFLPVKTY